MSAATRPKDEGTDRAGGLQARGDTAQQQAAVHFLRRIVSDRHTVIQFLSYASIGGFVQVVDIGLFRTFLYARTVPEVAATIAGAIAMVVHFSLNKYVNFRNHDRPVYRQARTYLAVGVVWWIVTLVIIGTLTRVFGVPPLYAKLVAVAVNFPVGYVAHRYLTFGKGITETYLGWRAAQREKATGTRRA
jgi:putative flippase GtrA